ncbi:uncharacterized protein PAC_01291 [Phialocephala subalpina]|uniref:Uncharacterized protein n=1 Tax=Phialocephala subalpina TaxID=576137 RepID=A0A1L7WF69_9HELO|nr:uncharacterized protein PAC_01291 [Phialocephala subalpina]
MLRETRVRRCIRRQLQKIQDSLRYENEQQKHQAVAYMITRKPWGQHICLRCQRNLAKRSSHLQSPALSQTFPERRRYSQQVVRKVYDDKESNGNVADVDRVDGKKYEPASLQPQGRLRGHRGQFKREDLEELRGATTLGDKAKVIVLRDSILSKYTLQEFKAKKIKPKHINILGQLAEERGLVGEDEVTDNINAFRPKEGEYPQDLHGITDLVNEIVESFTTPQLENYIKNFEGRRQQEKSDNVWKANDPNAPITRITPWQPTVSDIEDHFDNDPLRGYVLQSHNPKQRLVLRLMRECWMFELPELSDGIGQFEVRVRSDDLDLLLFGHNSILNTIHTTYLPNAEERLEVFRSRNTIRVTTTHAKKYAIVDAIQQAVDSIKRGTFNLNGLIPRGADSKKLEEFMETHFDDAALARLSEITNTKIVRTDPRHLSVSCTEHNPDASSSRLDAVRRLLLTSDNFSSRLEHELAIKQKKSTEGALVDYALTGGLSWRQQMRDWKRFAAPISKEDPYIAKAPVEQEKSIEPDLSSLPSTQTSTNEHPPKIWEPLIDAEKSESTLHWSTRLFTETSALMGTVLHSTTPYHTPLTPKSTPLNTLGLLHTFNTKVPNLSRVLSKADAKKNSRPTKRLVLRFAPDPFFPILKSIRKVKYPSSKKEVPIGVEALSAFPSIEMIFDIDPRTKEPKLYTVNAVIQEKKTDVMVPENAVDVRFQQKITSRLSRKFLKPIKSFLFRSQLSLAAKGKLDTPPSIILPISKHLCRDEGFKILGLKGEVGDEQEIRYLFTGLEIHSTLVFNWKSFRVLYTSIEAGKAIGRRSELKIRPIKNGQVATEADFVKAAYRLADMLGDGTGEFAD